MSMCLYLHTVHVSVWTMCIGVDNVAQCVTMFPDIARMAYGLPSERTTTTRVHNEHTIPVKTQRSSRENQRLLVCWGMREPARKEWRWITSVCWETTQTRRSMCHSFAQGKDSGPAKPGQSAKCAIWFNSPVQNKYNLN